MSTCPRILAACFACSTLLFTACGPGEVAPEVGEDERSEVESGLCSSSDKGGLVDGSPQALGVLRVANELPEATLRTGVKLSVLAARNIAKARVGADNVAGTADDRRFTTLKELSAVCEVGNAAFRKLITYAAANPSVGVDLPILPCAGDLSALEYQGLYGNTSWLTVKAERWTRSCNENAGAKSCAAWTKVAVDDAPSVYGGDLVGRPDFQVKVQAVNGEASIALTNLRASSYWGTATVGATGGGSTALDLVLSYRGYKVVCDDYSWGGGSGSGGCLRSHYDYFTAQWLQMKGTVSESCLRVADAVQQGSHVTFAPGVVSYVETVRTISTAP